ncbi:MAG: hypothetical protein K8S97_01165 [Anaerolineae bacterium]|nr:hypothetical protein [Anaerolineae bacterium]
MHTAPYGPINTAVRELLAAAGSTPYDLAENRQGRLTPQQRAAHERRLRWHIWPVLVAWSLIAAMLGVVPFSGTKRLDWAIVFAVALIVPVWYALRLRRSLRKLACDAYVIDHVAFKTGDWWKPRRTPRGVVFVAGGYLLLMPHRVLRHLHRKRWYRVYFMRAPDDTPPDSFTYTPGGHFLVLSIEPVGKHAARDD